MRSPIRLRAGAGGGQGAVRDALDPKGAIQMRAAFFEGDIYEGKAAAAIADLPGREELLVMLLQPLQAAPRQVLGVMQAPAQLSSRKKMSSPRKQKIKRAKGSRGNGFRGKNGQKGRNATNVNKTR